LVAKEKPSLLTNDFDDAYFSSLFLPELEKLFLKAFLATEQRIPGLGNGVLQDILYNAKLHPKRKIASLQKNEREELYLSIKNTLKQMTEQGGRDTERDLFGEPGGYATRVSKNTVGKPCPHCNSLVVKEAYMGGSIYYCP
jgi:formamidopyrimidine-DNA glycosylase